MARVVVTVACVIPSTGIGQPAVTVAKGAVIEATPAMLTAITAAGGTTRAVLTVTQHDLLGEGFAVSNTSA